MLVTKLQVLSEILEMLKYELVYNNNHPNHSARFRAVGFSSLQAVYAKIDVKNSSYECSSCMPENTQYTH